MKDRRQAQGVAPIVSVAGRGLPLRGDDVDTDRIMPARFLRATSFDGLERHLFEDDRFQSLGSSPSSPSQAVFVV